MPVFKNHICLSPSTRLQRSPQETLARQDCLASLLGSRSLAALPYRHTTALEQLTVHTKFKHATNTNTPGSQCGLPLGNILLHVQMIGFSSVIRISPPPPPPTTDKHHIDERNQEKKQKTLTHSSRVHSIQYYIWYFQF